MSYNGNFCDHRIGQLVQFDEFTEEEAEYAVANIKADFKQAAVDKARSYQQNMSMSTEGIRNQMLQFEGFTEEEVEYAISKLQK
mgnify:CR=1 FL=1